MNKKTLAATGLVAVLALGLSLAPQTNAFWPFDNDNEAGQTSTKREAPMQNMMQRLSEKLGLNQDKVKTAFSEIRTERQAEAKTQFEANLAQAVTDGKITEDQKNYIMEKHTAISAKQDEVKQLQDELHTWATENNINLPIMGGMMGKGRGMGRDMGGRGNW